MPTARKKVEVFEGAELAEMEGDRNPDDKALLLPIFGRADQRASNITDGGTEDEQKTEAPIPLRIKIIAGNDEQNLFCRKMSLQRGHCRRNDKKKQQKAESGEQHPPQPGARPEKKDFTPDKLCSRVSD